MRCHVGSILALLAVLAAVPTHGQTLRSVPKPEPSDVRVTKLESRLAEMLARPAAKAAAAKAAALPLGVQSDGEGRIVVLIEPLPGRPSTDVDVAGLEALGGSVLARSRHLLRMAIPIGRLLEACEIPGVNFIRTPRRPNSHAVSEGVTLTEANGYHRNGLLGAGVKVAVIDNGFLGANRLADELPATVRTRDFTGNGQYGGNVHGTACAEIVYDIAPEAELHLLRVSDLLDLENATDYCIAQDIDIVSNSNGWDTNGFGDGRGLACDIVNEANRNGILWVNAAGNEAQRTYLGSWTDENRNSWQDIFSSTSEIIRLRGVSIGDTVDVSLVWNDFPLTSEDYDLTLYRVSGSEVESVAVSETTQRNSRPIETIEYLVQTDATYGVAIRKASFARSTAVKLISSNHEFVDGTTAGSIGVPADAVGAYAVGAVSYWNWASSTIADYSSRGPTADGRIKPDISAPAGVQTRSYSVGFGGTSAATPHVAGAAALLLSVEPSRTPNEIRSAIGSSARDAGTTGKDNTFGDGLMTLPSPPRFVTTVQTPTDRYWSLAGGEVNSTNLTWQFQSFSRSGSVLEVVGTTSRTVTNNTSSRLKMSYSVHFLRTDASEIIRFFLPSPAELTLDVGGSHHLEIPFTARFSGLAEVGEVATVAVFASFVETDPPPFAASGRVTLSGQSNHAGVTIMFTRVSGSGTVPSLVRTTSNGSWSRTGFLRGTTYRATPSRAGWTFSPASVSLTGATTSANFTGTAVTYSASGRITLSGQSNHSGVAIRFTRVSGSGTIPPPVQTTSNGSWSANGFQPGTTYRASPTRTGWVFDPPDKEFDAESNPLNFTGLARYRVSGKVTLTGQSDHAGVQVSFRRASGNGSLPSSTVTSSDGTWTRTGFQPGTTYLAVASHAGWSFNPKDARFSGVRRDLNFRGTSSPYTASGRVTLSGQSNHSGVTIRFTRVSGSGTIPSLVRTTSNGSWSATGFQPGTTYRASPSRTGWTFSPASQLLTRATTSTNFTGTSASYAASGRVTLSGQSNHSGVTIRFTRVSGSGTVPSLVRTTSNGSWSANGFQPGTTYRARPSRTGWTFLPASLFVTRTTTSANFTGTGAQATYSASGRVTLSGQTNHSGVMISFTRVSGSGTIPSVVRTTSNGNWSASGFQPGTTYRATPSRTGWAFLPASSFLTRATTSANFTGTGISTQAQIPSTGDFGYNPPNVNGEPAVARFAFESTRNAMALTWDQWSDSEDAVAVWLNGSILWSANHEAGTQWHGWWGIIPSNRLRTSGNTLEFRHAANARRTQNYDRWGIRDVELWKPYLAKPVGSRQYPGADVQVNVSVGDAFPSPANAAVTLPISVRKPVELEVSVVNLLGQRVVLLHSGLMAPGENRLVWSGLDAKGQRVSSGVYLFLTRGHDFMQVKRSVYLE